VENGRQKKWGQKKRGFSEEGGKPVFSRTKRKKGKSGQKRKVGTRYSRGKEKGVIGSREGRLWRAQGLTGIMSSRRPDAKVMFFTRGKGGEKIRHEGLFQGGHRIGQGEGLSRANRTRSIRKITKKGGIKREIAALSWEKTHQMQRHDANKARNHKNKVVPSRILWSGKKRIRALRTTGKRAMKKRAVLTSNASQSGHLYLKRESTLRSGK